MTPMHVLRQVIAASLVMAGAGACAPGQQHAPALERPRRVTQGLDPSVKFGRGYDRVADALRDACIDFSGPSPLPQANGQTTYFALDVLGDAKAVVDKLALSAAEEIRADVVGADAKALFVNGLQFNASSVYLFVHAIVLDAPLNLDSVRLKADAASTLVQDAARFRERCGDGYVDSIALGAELALVLEVEVTSNQERQALGEQLSLGAVDWGGRNDVASRVEKVVATNVTHLHAYEAGGLGVGPSDCATFTCVMSHVEALPGVAQAHPTALGVSVVGYDRLARPADAQALVDVSVAEQAQIDAVAQLLTQRDLSARYQAALDRPALFAPFRRDDVVLSMQIVASNLAALRAMETACSRDYTRCAVPVLHGVPVPPPTFLWNDACAVLRRECKNGALSDDSDTLQNQCVGQGGAPVDLGSCQ